MSDRQCAFCGARITEGQHFLEAVILTDTAGLEHIVREPTAVFTGIYDTPGCLAFAMSREATQHSAMTEPFLHP